MSVLNTRVLKHQGKSRAWVERIVCDHGVFVKSPVSVQALSVACSREYGGTPEMWVKQNKSKCGLFGSTGKIVPKYTFFRWPEDIVVEANAVFFNLGI